MVGGKKTRATTEVVGGAWHGGAWYGGRGARGVDGKLWVREMMGK